MTSEIQNFQLSGVRHEVKKLSDKLLLAQIDQLSAHERKVTILVLRHLREIERRRLFVELGYSSMHTYCIKHLKYSEGQTQRRLASARLMMELPEIEKEIQEGSLNVTNLSRFQSFVRAEKVAACPLTREEKLTTLTELQNKSTREVERELIQRAHQPEILVERYHNISVAHAEVESLKNFVKFEALLSEQNQQLLQEFKNLYAHELDDQANVSVLTFLLTKAVQHKKKQKGLIADKKSNALPPSAAKVPDHKKGKPEIKRDSKLKYRPIRKPPSVAVRKFIWNRAGGCCEYVTGGHQRCSSQFALEIDHIVPFGLGGTNDPKNLQLLCRAHNSRRAVKTFGVYR